MNKPNQKSWDKLELAKLVVLFRKGYSFNEISKVLSRSRASCESKMFKLFTNGKRKQKRFTYSKSDLIQAEMLYSNFPFIHKLNIKTKLCFCGEKIVNLHNGYSACETDKERIEEIRQITNFRTRKSYIRNINKRRKRALVNSRKQFNKERRNKRVRKKYQDDKDFRYKDKIVRLTRKKYGNAKSCLICKRVKHIEWHHYTLPYEVDKVIPLCRLHHRTTHNRDAIINFKRDEEKVTPYMINRSHAYEKGEEIRT